MIQRMSQRAGKYLYYIVDQVNQRGLPTELALLPFVESAYDPTALSRSKASGLWQFIPSTGLHYNLQQTWWHDQRRDRSEEHTSELQSLMRISYAVFCLKKKKHRNTIHKHRPISDT